MKAKQEWLGIEQRLKKKWNEKRLVAQKSGKSYDKTSTDRQRDTEKD